MVEVVRITLDEPFGALYLSGVLVMWIIAMVHFAVWYHRRGIEDEGRISMAIMFAAFSALWPLALLVVAVSNSIWYFRYRRNKNKEVAQ